MPKIALEASGLLRRHPTGIPVYIKNLAYALGRSSQVELELCYKFSRYKKRGFAPEINGVGRNWYMGPFYLSTSWPDIIHSSDTKIPNIPFTKLVATIHDLAVLHPDHMFDGFTNEKFREKSREKYQKIIKRADAIISVSECTKRDFLTHFDYPEDKVFVTHLGFSKHVEAIDGSLQVQQIDPALKPKKYFMYVGSLTYRKNIANLVKAFDRANLPDDYALLLVGQPGMGFDKIEAALNGLTKRSRILMPGYIDDKWMGTLYRNAKAFLFPTFYEGFGLPIIEAMSSGLPVLAANRGSAPEVGGDHAIYADPFSVDSIAAGIEKTLGKTTAEIEAAKAHAGSFTWDKTAQKTMHAYETILSS